MKRTFAVIGLGTLGRTVCEVLTAKGGSVIAFDNNVQQLNRVKDTVSQAILMDTSDADAISDAPFDQVDAAIVAIGDNIEASILTATLLKQMGVPYIISRAVNRIHAQVLKKIGADRVINIEEELGARLAEELSAPTVLQRVQLSRDYFLQEIAFPNALEFQKSFAGGLLDQYHIYLSAVRRVETSLDADGNSLTSERIIHPREDLEFREGDVLICMGNQKDLEQFSRRVSDE